jgi:hypothetical protein
MVALPSRRPRRHLTLNRTRARPRSSGVAKRVSKSTDKKGTPADPIAETFAEQPLNSRNDVFDRTGKKLGAVEVDVKPTNCTFGGADRRTLYITPTATHATRAGSIPRRASTRSGSISLDCLDRQLALFRRRH